MQKPSGLSLDSARHLENLQQMHEHLSLPPPLDSQGAVLRLVRSGQHGSIGEEGSSLSPSVGGDTLHFSLASAGKDVVHKIQESVSCPCTLLLWQMQGYKYDGQLPWHARSTRLVLRPPVVAKLCTPRPLGIGLRVRRQHGTDIFMFANDQPQQNEVLEDGVIVWDHVRLLW